MVNLKIFEFFKGILGILRLCTSLKHNTYINPAKEIPTTKFQDCHQFLPSHDVEEHIHSQVCGRYSTVEI